MTTVSTSVVSTSVPNAIVLRKLRFSWSPKVAPLLDIGYLDIARGERLFLYGPSGSGKTTLLNLLAGIACAQQGELEVLGHNLSKMSQRQRDKFRARHMGVIFQQFNLIPYLSVLDNVLLGAHFSGLPPAASRARAQQQLSELGLTAELLDRPARELSVGQQQRVAVARALIAEPEILIADEPSSALDSDSRDAFIDLLLTCAEATKSTVIFVSHDRSLQHHFSRVVNMRELLSEEGTDNAGVAC